MNSNALFIMLPPKSNSISRLLFQLSHRFQLLSFLVKFSN